LHCEAEILLPQVFFASVLTHVPKEGAPQEPVNEKARYLLDSGLSFTLAGCNGGLGRNRTTDTRIFNSD